MNKRITKLETIDMKNISSDRVMYVDFGSGDSSHVTEIDIKQIVKHRKEGVKK